MALMALLRLVLMHACHIRAAELLQWDHEGDLPKKASTKGWHPSMKSVKGSKGLRRASSVSVVQPLVAGQQLRTLSADMSPRLGIMDDRVCALHATVCTHHLASCFFTTLSPDFCAFATCSASQADLSASVSAVRQNAYAVPSSNSRSSVSDKRCSSAGPSAAPHPAPSRPSRPSSCFARAPAQLRMRSSAMPGTALLEEFRARMVDL